MWLCFYKLSTRAWGCVCYSLIKGLEAGVDEKIPFIWEALLRPGYTVSEDGGQL